MNNITNIVLTDYQVSCIKKIDEKLLNGAKHISVTMDVGMGLTTMAAFYLKKMVEESYGRVAVVYYYKMSLEQGIEQAVALGVGEKVDFYSIKAFVEQDKEYDYVLLHDFQSDGRIIVEDYLSNKDVKTISFFTFGQDIVGAGLEAPSPIVHVHRYMNMFYSNASVFSTREVLDIRDAKRASVEEIEHIKIDNAFEINQAYIINKETVVELRRQEDRVKRLRAYAEFARAIKPKEKEEQEKKIKACEKEIDDLNKIVLAQGQRLHFFEDILKAAGIDTNVVNEAFNEIQSLREQLKDKLESENIEERESALKQLQDKTAETIAQLVQAEIKKADYDKYEREVKERLSDSVWNKLEPNSQTFLISAKSSFDSLKEMEQSDNLDYSGVCLLVTKALEIETTKRFFQKYVLFLQRKYNSVSRWPFALRQREHGHITDNVIQDHEFTLGSVVSVVGMKRDYDENNNIIGYSVSNERARNEFLDYAMNDLYKSSNRAEVEAEVERDYRFIEKVRIDYRNPSAHRGRLTRTSAQSCLEYVIDVQHMLKDMLEGMKI